jgi:hypothetical protein
LRRNHAGRATKQRPSLRPIWQVSDDFDRELPCDAAVLMAFLGVAPHYANLALDIACG